MGQMLPSLSKYSCVKGYSLYFKAFKLMKCYACGKKWTSLATMIALTWTYIVIWFSNTKVHTITSMPKRKSSSQTFYYMQLMKIV
jgi:hypothetical protein